MLWGRSERILNGHKEKQECLTIRVVQNSDRLCRKAVELSSFEISKTIEERPSVAWPNFEVSSALRKRFYYIPAIVLYNTIVYAFY